MKKGLLTTYLVNGKNLEDLSLDELIKEEQRIRYMRNSYNNKFGLSF